MQKCQFKVSANSQHNGVIHAMCLVKKIDPTTKRYKVKKVMEEKEEEKKNGELEKERKKKEMKKKKIRRNVQK